MVVTSAEARGDWAKQGAIEKIKRQTMEMKRIRCSYYARARLTIYR
jgi:hypothetical protein